MGELNIVIVISFYANGVFDFFRVQQFLYYENNKKIHKTPFFLIGFFLLLWMIGLAVGEPSRVLEQAKSICLACIGIG